MRRRKTDIHRRVNGNLRIEFTKTDLTSYAGLELLIRYFQSIELNRLIRSFLSSTGLTGDFGITGMFRLFIGLVMVGAERLRHILYLDGDPVFERFCGLASLPSSRTMSRWLKSFTATSYERLQDLNAKIVSRMIQKLPIRTLTLDVDGTVVSTGLKVSGALRGYNPHKRKVPSYYPITAHVGETGHLLRVRNRSGNVHDGASSIRFLHKVFAQVDKTLGRRYRLNLRMDGAFFLEKVIRLLQEKKAGYAIKVPFWRWIDLKGHIQGRKRWYHVASKVEYFEKNLRLDPWGMTLRVVIYRKKVMHKTRKNYQLDLFDPNDGYYEYSAVATNLSYDGKELWRFMSGRGAHEKVIGELKSGLAFDTIPTDQYLANSVWQQLVVIAHNLLTNFQIDCGATPRKRSWKRTALYNLKSIATIRFELLNRAGQIVRPAGSAVMRICKNDRIERMFNRIVVALNAKAG